MKVLLVIGLFCGVLARDCLKPQVLSSFDKNKFEGDWFSLAFQTPNKSEEVFYKDTKCSLNRFKLDQNGDSFTGEVDYLLGSNHIHYTGTFVLQDPSKANMKVKFASYPLAYTYDVVCSDYTTWAIIYSCAQIQDGHSSEFISLMGRDRRKYEELIQNEDAQQCFRGNLKSSMALLQRRPQEDCNN
uniref:Uncharacterized protein n=1 Tax=Clastoptera arizonana TaxID=38151 RepID=A0A1B6C3D4_9HEMI